MQPLRAPPDSTHNSGSACRHRAPRPDGPAVGVLRVRCWKFQEVVGPRGIPALLPRCVLRSRRHGLPGLKRSDLRRAPSQHRLLPLQRWFVACGRIVRLLSLCSRAVRSPGPVRLCPLCSPGTYSSASGTVSACHSCAAGIFATQHGATACEGCPPGTHGQPCSAGTFQSSAPAASCASCSPGTYFAVVGATSASVCQNCGTATYWINVSLRSARRSPLRPPARKAPSSARLSLASTGRPVPAHWSARPTTSAPLGRPRPRLAPAGRCPLPGPTCACSRARASGWFVFDGRMLGHAVPALTWNLRRAQARPMAKVQEHARGAGRGNMAQDHADVTHGIDQVNFSFWQAKVLAC